MSLSDGIKSNSTEDSNKGSRITIIIERFPSGQKRGSQSDEALRCALDLALGAFCNLAIYSDDLRVTEFIRAKQSFPSTICTSKRPPDSPLEWSFLALDIHTWLRNNLDSRNTHEWKWALNYFWILYCGGIPQFPATRLDVAFPWDFATIPLAGEYISTRLAKVAMCQPLQDENDQERFALLEESEGLRNTFIKRGIYDHELARLEVSL